MIRALPKRLQKLVAANPDKIVQGHTEQDDFNGTGTWSHWIYLRKGWHNAGLDPAPGLHIIHEPYVADCIQQFRNIKPCNCEECQS